MTGVDDVDGFSYADGFALFGLHITRYYSSMYLRPFRSATSPLYYAKDAGTMRRFDGKDLCLKTQIYYMLSV